MKLPAVVLGCTAGLVFSGCAENEDPGAGYASPTVSQANVFVGQANDAEAGEISWAWARFFRPSPAETCALLAAQAGCKLIECPLPDASVSTPSGSLEAGKITITAQQTLELVRDADGVYPLLEMTGSLWAPEQAISIAVEGREADPPAFSGEVIGPGPITLIEPASGPVGASRSQALTFSWQGSPSGWVSLQNVAGDTETTRVYCSWPASAQTGSLPPTMMSALSAGTHRFALSVDSAQTVQTYGSWAFVIGASLKLVTLDVTLG